MFDLMAMAKHQAKQNYHGCIITRYKIVFLVPFWLWSGDGSKPLLIVLCEGLLIFYNSLIYHKKLKRNIIYKSAYMLSIKQLDLTIKK